MDLSVTLRAIHEPNYLRIDPTARRTGEWRIRC